jgi:CHAD domain-containing protein
MAEGPVCCDLAAGCVEERVENVRWALARLPLASDAEAVHDVRVALRRLRAAWSGFAKCLAAEAKRRRRLRRGERELGALRDAEVRLGLLDEVLGPVAVWADRSDDPRILGGPGGAVVLDRSSRLRPGLRGLEMEARRTLADSTSAQIDQHRRVGLTEGALERFQLLASPVVLTPGHPGSALAPILAQEQLPRLFRRAGRQGSAEVDLHRRRIQIRKLRYRLELFAPVLGRGHQSVLQELRQVQSLLGRFHDLTVLAAWIEGSSQELSHELRPALRRLSVRVGLEQQVAREAAETELTRLDEAGWWSLARAACLG